MKDSLREHINQNRNDFESFHDDFDASWNVVEARLNQHDRKQRFKVVLKIAAAVVFWLVAGMGFLQFYSFDTTQNDSFTESSEYFETEQYYDRLIQEKIEIIQTRQGELEPEILEDVQQLDLIYEELRNDLADNANNQEVIEAMIKQQRLKLSVLEQILEKLEENDHENTPHNL